MGKISYDIKSILYKYNLTPIEEYTDSKTPFACRDEEGYILMVKILNLIKDIKMFKFHVINKHTIENIENWISINNLKLKLKEGQYYSGANANLEWICEDCDEIVKSSWGNVQTNKKIYCKRCSDGVSVPEKFISNILSQLNIKFEPQFSAVWSKRKRYDFYIPSLNTIIEAHGMQHYENVSRGRKLQEEMENDNIKHSLALNNVNNYIIIDCRKSEFEWLKYNCAKQLFDFLNIDNVNWDLAWEYSQNNMCIKSWGLKNENPNILTSEIGRILNIGDATIVKYLKIGSELNKCNYNTEEEKDKSKNRIGARTSIPVNQYTLSGDFIKEWTSAYRASKILNIDSTGICKCCKGIFNTSNGYIWKYKTEPKE